MRLVDPSAGAIRIGGEDAARLGERRLRRHRRDIQLAFRNPYRSLNPRRPVGQSDVEGPMRYGVWPTQAPAKTRKPMPGVGREPNSLTRLHAPSPEGTSPPPSITRE